MSRASGGKGLSDGLKPAAVRLADLEEGQDGGGVRSGEINLEFAGR